MLNLIPHSRTAAEPPGDEGLCLIRLILSSSALLAVYIDPGVHSL
jgi:hypothetical protein